jgi:hypothetical protein
MKTELFTVCLGLLISSSCFAADRYIDMYATPGQPMLGDTIMLQCSANGDWRRRLRTAKVTVTNPTGQTVVSSANMGISKLDANYTIVIPLDQQSGTWQFSCTLSDRRAKITETAEFVVAPLPTDPSEVPPLDDFVDGSIPAHNTITNYDGPVTCISCHQTEATEMLQSLHMQWDGPTPDLINTSGEPLGKAVGGINTFCTYAMSSQSACFSCHVRADGNAPDPVKAEDVDCMMCHQDTYQRKFVSDPANTETVVNIEGVEKTYVFGKVDSEGNYSTEPDYAKMPAGTNMVNLARTVHMPTNSSCLRCHAKAGGGDWTKRGDIGLNSAHATLEQDYHLSKDGANLSCVDCHSALNHKIAGRGIDLRQTEAKAPTCAACHTEAPHASTTLNRHAQGQVSCQVCHIREFGKGGATEMSRDWTTPVWDQAFCSGQGGFIGHEVKEANVKPEYVWFDGTSYVYNIGETIEPDERGVLPMAKAHGTPFDGRSHIFPIKRHFSNMPLDADGKIIPPAIMWMFMTGDFDLAIQKGIEEQSSKGIEYTGNYDLFPADAEMLITHGVDPKSKAPSCIECHDGSGSTPEGQGMLPFDTLGYHTVPNAVASCTLCHEKKSMKWDSMHQSHRQDNIACASCHTSEPAGFVKPQKQLCSSCHENKSWRADESHKKHAVEKKIDCITCHTFG